MPYQGVIDQLSMFFLTFSFFWGGGISVFSKGFYLGKNVMLMLFPSKNILLKWHIFVVLAKGEIKISSKSHNIDLPGFCRRNISSVHLPN